MLEDLKKAGKIARRALEYAKSLAKEETSILEIAEKVEQYIIDLGGFPAFPINLSINEIAAHYTPDLNDKTVLKQGDVLKIDIGVHVNGWIVDVAETIEVNDTKYKDLIKACKEALENVKKNIRKDIELWEIGEIIEKTIKSYGFNPIYNLGGHSIEQYILHSGKFIPNYNNKCREKVPEYFAVEPFATNGIGQVKDGNPSGIYQIICYKKTRIPELNKFLDLLYEKFRTLPFAKRWIYKIYDKKEKIELFLNFLKKEGILYEYPILVEKSLGIVTQFETTFYIKDKVIDLLEV